MEAKSFLNTITQSHFHRSLSTIRRIRATERTIQAPHSNTSFVEYIHQRDLENSTRTIAPAAPVTCPPKKPPFSQKSPSRKVKKKTLGNDENRINFESRTHFGRERTHEIYSIELAETVEEFMARSWRNLSRTG